MSAAPLSVRGAWPSPRTRDWSGASEEKGAPGGFPRFVGGLEDVQALLKLQGLLPELSEGGGHAAYQQGLERRIAALVTSGEEDTSYTEAVEALKKQLNRRRHNILYPQQLLPLLVTVPAVQGGELLF